MEKKGALQGVKVLDLTRVLAGPYCSAILADLGADVIKIEQPGTGDDARFFNPFVNGESSYYMNLNRNKRGITLDLKKGKDIFLKMVKSADVVVENFRPGVMTKLGVDYESLKKVNPQIIYAAISGFGQHGPYSQWPGYDLIAQAMSGIMSVTGEADGEPTRAGGPICDVIGGMTASIGILAAVQYRNRTGVGQMLDISLLDSAVASMAIINQHYLVDGRIPQRRGNSYESGAPMESYKASDGDIVLAVGNDKMWKKLVELMEMPELLEIPEFETVHKRVQNRKSCKEFIEQWSKKRTVADLVKNLLDVGIPAAPIYNIAQVCNDPHIAGARNMFVEFDHPQAGKVKVTNSAIRMSETDAGVTRPAPVLGQDNEDVYQNVFGFLPKEIEDFRKEGII
ncbi:carnitine dehydratase [Anaerosporomusa subterranea]|jgi:formyl-CoA transferase|uniref:Carnitine dehydratase n=1 Tax=Anaerosporomusa subterranea TaxID=1794912 RepID=A0A154BNC5_ANASB|nr:CaiB/BaiF CoA-transferase family protein [Anaerosporomusa subterranea]KYZ75474.1 carnitine dehydratase [Anaerosporomusa subterranea]MDF2502080.1 yfdE 1 [Anaerosporomusa subterranea]